MYFLVYCLIHVGCISLSAELEELYFERGFERGFDLGFARVFERLGTGFMNAAGGGLLRFVGRGGP